MDPRVDELIQDNQLVPGLRSANKFEVLEMLVNRLRELHGIPIAAVSAVLDAVFRQERERPSGLPGGVAAPYGQSDLLPASALIIGLAPEGVDFGSSDGSRSRVIVLCVEGKGELPRVSRTAILHLLGRNPQLVERLSGASTGSEARAMFRETLAGTPS